MAVRHPPRVVAPYGCRVPKSNESVDKPLPRFLDDAAAAKLLRTARQDTDPLARLVTELLARTGMRRGELLDLTVDALVDEMVTRMMGFSSACGPAM